MTSNIHLHIEAPSKTFIVGEYVAVTGGPTLVLNTPPFFQLEAYTRFNRSTDMPIFSGIEKVTPAGKYLKKHLFDFQGVEIKFQDPYKLGGGFGASSAQYGFLVCLREWLNNPTKPNPIHINQLIEEYQDICGRHHPGPPRSGVDIVAQLAGHITYYHKNQQELATYNWPFADIVYCLIRTGEKVATHEHLRESPKFEEKPLEPIVMQTLKHLQNQEGQKFSDTVTQYGRALADQGLVHENTVTLLNSLLERPGVMGAKGCGALGADVILALVQKDHLSELGRWLHDRHLDIAFAGQSTQMGIAESMDLKLTFG